MFARYVIIFYFFFAQICFDSIGKPTLAKKNLRKFEGFEFDAESPEYKKRVEAAQKVDLAKLKVVCEGLDIDKKGMFNFLYFPVQFLYYFLNTRHKRRTRRKNL